MRPASHLGRGDSLWADMPSSANSPLIIPTLSAAELQELLSAGRSALVAFSAPWCLYELALLPRMARLHHLLQGRILVGWLDVTQCPELVESLKIRWIPAVGHLCRGRPARRWYGADVDIEQILASVLRRERSEPWNNG